ncbi:MAG TPA: aldo/keto reductase [Bacillota bacterium]|nr:aldo/keto reductase [Bacillota bacterium]
MEYYQLGNTGLKVSALCFGALPMGPLQANLAPEEGGQLILEALRQGVNFIDTAQMYQTYPHIKWALERFEGPVVLASKATAVKYREMQSAIEQSLNELGRDSLEIFHLHASRDNDPLVNREEALNAILDYKAKGYIKYAGVACHSVLAVRQAVADPRIDVVFPLINRAGLGILDGGVAEMTDAIRMAQQAGKGLYAMKAFGGGNLLADLELNLQYVRETVGVPVVAVGMIRKSELDTNLALFEGRSLADEYRAALRNYHKKAIVLDFLCKGCGLCQSHCHSKAITIVAGKAVIASEKCLLCGYCSKECPQFAIRVI